MALAGLTLVVRLPSIPATPAFAQIDPDDTGEGVRLGMSQERNSGQTGTVTLLARGASRTLVVTQLFSVPQGRREIARVARAPACRGARPTAVFPAWAGTSGRIRGIVTLGAARLLSGNYIVEAFARPGGARLSCGELHR